MKTLKGWLLLVTISCVLHSRKSTNNNDSSIYLQLNDQLEHATGVIKKMTSIYSHNLDSKTFQPFNAEKATIWMSNANQVSAIISKLTATIDSIKRVVKPTGNLTELEKIKEKTSLFYNDISKVDAAITKQFKAEINKITAFQDSFNILSTNMPPMAIVCLLSKIQNQLSILENYLVAYCDNQVSSSSDAYYKTMPFVHQNATHLRRDEELQIDVSVVNPGNPIFPKVYINGDSISQSDNGFYHYQLKVEGKPGKYALPIKIEYYEHQQKVSLDKPVVYYLE